MKIKPAFLLTATIFLPLVAQAKSNAMLERFNVGGYVNIQGTTPYAFKPHSNPRPLPLLSSAIKNQMPNKGITTALSRYLDTFPATTGLLLIDRGQILFERYQGKGTPSSEFYSMSIGKSMTSLALGKLLCAGGIPSLDVIANTLIPELGNSGYGKSTIRQLLTMSSGAYTPFKYGQPEYKNGIGKNPINGKSLGSETWAMRLGQVTVEDILWGPLWDNVLSKHPNSPGGKFQYKSGDTLTISKIIERKAELSTAAYFDKMIWQKIRSAKTGHWEADRDGSTIANAGFQASLKDWGRIALWVLDSFKSEDCYSNYLKKATTTQIKVSLKKGTHFQGYGYQWWIFNQKSSSFWGLGYAGQILAIHPPSGKIMIKFSYRKDPRSSSHLRKIFNQWIEEQ